jgi:hypothetical protein
LTIEFTHTQQRNNRIAQSNLHYLIRLRRPFRSWIIGPATTRNYLKTLNTDIQLAFADSTRKASLLSLVVMFTQSIQLSKIVCVAHRATLRITKTRSSSCSRFRSCLRRSSTSGRFALRPIRKST